MGRKNLEESNRKKDVELLIPFLIISGFLKTFLKEFFSKIKAMDDPLEIVREEKIQEITKAKGELESETDNLSVKDDTLNRENIRAFQQQILQRDELKKNPDYARREIIPGLEIRIATKSEEVKDCYFCKLPIFEGEEFYRCFTCELLFHRMHLEDWLQDMDECPLCKQQFILYFEENDT